MSATKDQHVDFMKHICNMLLITQFSMLTSIQPSEVSLIHHPLFNQQTYCYHGNHFFNKARAATRFDSQSCCHLILRRWKRFNKSKDSLPAGPARQNKSSCSDVLVSDVRRLKFVPPSTAARRLTGDDVIQRRV